MQEAPPSGVEVLPGLNPSGPTQVPTKKAGWRFPFRIVKTERMDFLLHRDAHANGLEAARQSLEKSLGEARAGASMASRLLVSIIFHQNRSGYSLSKADLERATGWAVFVQPQEQGAIKVILQKSAS